MVSQSQARGRWWWYVSSFLILGGGVYLLGGFLGFYLDRYRSLSEYEVSTGSRLVFLSAGLLLALGVILFLSRYNWVRIKPRLGFVVGIPLFLCYLGAYAMLGVLGRGVLDAYLGRFDNDVLGHSLLFLAIGLFLFLHIARQFQPIRNRMVVAITCPACQKSYGNSITTCPYCTKPHKRWLKASLLGIVLLGMVYMVPGLAMLSDCYGTGISASDFFVKRRINLDSTICDLKYQPSCKVIGSKSDKTKTIRLQASSPYSVIIPSIDAGGNDIDFTEPGNADQPGANPVAIIYKWSVAKFDREKMDLGYQEFVQDDMPSFFDLVFGTTLRLLRGEDLEKLGQRCKSGNLRIWTIESVSNRRAGFLCKAFRLKNTGKQCRGALLILDKASGRQILLHLAFNQQEFSKVLQIVHSLTKTIELCEMDNSSDNSNPTIK